MLTISLHCVQFTVITIHTVFSIRFNDLRDGCTVPRMCKLGRNPTNWNQIRVHNSFVCSRVNDSTRITNFILKSKFAIFCLRVILLGLVQPCGNSKVIITLSPKYILLIWKRKYSWCMEFKNAKRIWMRNLICIVMFSWLTVKRQIICKSNLHASDCFINNQIEWLAL